MEQERLGLKPGRSALWHHAISRPNQALRALRQTEVNHEEAQRQEGLQVTFDEWWRVTGQLDECGKDDWRECWEAAQEEAAKQEREQWEYCSVKLLCAPAGSEEYAEAVRGLNELINRP